MPRSPVLAAPTKSGMWAEMEAWVFILLLVLGLLALNVIIVLGAAAIAGAFSLFGFASEQGFVGLAAYVAAWVFAFPVMLVICIGIGLFIMWDDYRTERRFRLLGKRMRDQKRMHDQ